MDKRVSRGLRSQRGAQGKSHQEVWREPGGEKEAELEENRKVPSMAKPQAKESEYLPQRRKGRKEKETIFFIRPWRSSRLSGRNIRIRDVSCIGNLRKRRKLSTIALLRTQRIKEWT
jgi:hypothetical protein